MYAYPNLYDIEPMKQTPLLFLALLVLVACTLPMAEAPATPTPAEPVVLRVVTLQQPPISQVTEAMAVALQARHPNVQVEIEQLPNDYPMSLLADAQSGNLPDVIFGLDVFVAPFADGGVLLNMEEYARGDRSVRLDDVYENFLAIGQPRNQPGLYLLPASLDTMQLFYNRTLWQQSGAPLPDADWTWDDLIAACKQIQQANPQVTCLSFANQDLLGFDWWVHWLPWVRGAGGDILTSDGVQSTLSDRATLEGLTAYTELWTKHRIALPPDRDNPECFVRQTCAATFFVPGGVRILREQIGQRFDWDVQLVPAHTRGRFSSMGTYGFGIGRTTRHPDLAWEFVRFLVTPEGQRELAAAGLSVPVLKSLANEPLDSPPTNMRIFVEAGPSGIATPIYPLECGTLYGGPVQDVIGRALRQIVNGAAPPQEVLTAADEQIQLCLNRQR